MASFPLTGGTVTGMSQGMAYLLQSAAWLVRADLKINPVSQFHPVAAEAVSAAMSSWQ